MKFLLSTLLLSISFLSFANDYTSYNFNCEVSGQVENLNQPAGTLLPKIEKLDFDIITLANKTKVLKINQLVNFYNISIEKAKVGYKYSSDYDIFDDNSYWFTAPKHIVIKNLTADESKETLTHLGAKDVPTLPTGFKFGKIKLESEFVNPPYSSAYRSYYFTKTAQVHLPLNTLDGLSYHLTISCRGK